MPLAAPIGSGLGVCNPYSIRDHQGAREGSGDRRCRRRHRVATRRSRWSSGVDALLMNTGIAAAARSGADGRGDAHAVDAGRKAFLAGRMAKRLYANASSPMERPHLDVGASIRQSHAFQNVEPNGAGRDSLHVGPVRVGNADLPEREEGKVARDRALHVA